MTSSFLSALLFYLIITKSELFLSLIYMSLLNFLYYGYMLLTHISRPSLKSSASGHGCVTRLRVSVLPLGLESTKQYGLLCPSFSVDLIAITRVLGPNISPCLATYHCRFALDSWPAPENLYLMFLTALGNLTLSAFIIQTFFTSKLRNKTGCPLNLL